MLKKMASKFILLLCIFLLVATNVFSFDEDLKIKVNYAKPSAPTVVIPIITVPPSQPAKTPASSPAPPPTSKTKPTPIVKSWKDCIPLCIYKCKLHLRKMSCITACMTCCDRCKCVPLDQTYGNRDKCGKCYTDMLTHHDKVKCP